MAKKPVGATFESFMRDVLKAPLRPVYAFVGENAYFAHQGTEALRARFLRDGAADAIDIFVGDEPAEVIFDHLRTADLFVSSRLVIILRGDIFLKPNADALAFYLEHPTAGSVLALVCATLDARTRLAKRIGSVGLQVACPKLYPERLVPWVRDRFRERGKPCLSAVAEALVDELGDDLFALTAEIEKLCTYVADRPCVELDDIRALVGHDHHCDVFALTDAVGRRDSARALGILADLVGAGEAPEMLVGQLGWQLRRLWAAKRLVGAGASQETVGRDLRVGPHFLSGFMDQVAHFSQLELARVFRQLVLTDLALTFVVQACSRVALPGL
jgi:DNA polymerase-3 subunit delta